MGELIDMEGARALVADRALWPRVRDFLWDFAPQVHPSWIEALEDLPASVASGLMSSPRVKRAILSAFGVEPCFHSFPKDDWSRLLLLDGATLESISKWLGALACADRLRGVTDGKTVRALKTALPGIYPEVFGYTMYFPRDCFSRKDAEAQGKASEISGDIVAQEGVVILFSLLSRLPQALYIRAKCKLPLSLSDYASLGETTVPQPTLGAALSKLLKLKFPEAYSLCCS